MIASQHIARRTQGFTLLEVLFAVAAASLVLLAIHMVFYGALRLRNKSVQALEEAVPLQHVLAIMKRDLVNLVPPNDIGVFSGPLQTTLTADGSTTSSSTSSSSSTSGSTGTSASSSQTGGSVNMGGETASGLAGLQVSPTLYTATGIIDGYSPWAETQKVTYYLVDPTNDVPGKDLIRSVTRNLLPVLVEESDDQWLMSGVEAVVFLFHDGTDWIETWDSEGSETNLPMAIKVQIELVAGETELDRRIPIELVVPVSVQSRNSQQALTEEFEL